jgi:hypothetical protein
MNVAPDGRAFFSGPDDMLLALDPTGGGTWPTFDRIAWSRAHVRASGRSPPPTYVCDGRSPAAAG